MEQFKKAKVVMLPTNEKTKHLMVYSDVEKTKGKLILNGLKNDEYKEYQHLYITSDDKIKEGDWFINDLNQIKKCISRDTKGYIDFEGGFNTKPSSCKKIIATTNPLLKIEIDGNRGDLLPDVSFDINLPQPSQQFIQKYIEEYNKGNVITDVLVEYEEGKSYSGNEGLIIKEWLKINPKYNTITIKKIKDSYTREEVEKLCKKAYREGQNYDTPDQCIMSDEISIEEFIRQNL